MCQMCRVGGSEWWYNPLHPWETDYLVSILCLHGGVPGPVEVHHVLPAAYHHNVKVFGTPEPWDSSSIK